MANSGAAVVGRWMYEAAGHWGDENPWGVPCYVVTHRPEEQPPGDAFRFVEGLEQAVEQAREAAGGKDVNIGGGADVIRQALEADLVDELTIIIAPITLGGGKRALRRLRRSLDLEHAGVRQSRYATFVTYRVRRGLASGRRRPWPAGSRACRTRRRASRGPGAPGRPRR